METRRVHHYILLLTTLLLSSSYYTKFSCAYQKKISHQKQIALDYLSSPLVSGDDYEKGMRSDYAPAKLVKRQDNRKPDDNIAPTTQPPTTTSSTTSATTLPPSVSTSLDETDNVTLTSSSDLPPTTEPSSEIPSSSTTTTTEATTLPTTPSPEEPTQIFPTEEEKSTKGYFCLCDYHVRVCDMECCCDPDCSPAEKRVFKRCNDYSMIYDPSNRRNKDHSCFKSYIMYRENSPYRTDRTDKSLFCVVNENVMQAQEFSHTDMARISKQISHGKIDTRPKYTWDSLHEESASTTINYDEPYKYGSAIWAVRSESENGEESRNFGFMFRLPAPFYNDMCSILEPVKYLQDSVSRCVRPLRDARSQCETLNELNANHFIRSLSIIINPRKLVDNSTDFVTELIIPVKLCYDTMQDCRELSPQPYSTISTAEGSEDIAEFPSPKLEGFFASDKCANVLSQLNLTFVHEGIQGITKILAKALLVKVPLDQKEIVQEFKTEYIWSNAASSKVVNGEGARNDTNTSSVEDVLFLRKLPRSGNPGYIVGKPLILGKMVMKRSNINDTDGKVKLVKRMHVLPDVAQWLHIQGAGDCPLSQDEIRDHPRHPILFGYDHVSSCNLPLENFQHCGELQRRIASIIFGLTGEMDPREFVKTPLYVAAYGSPDAFPSDWVQLNFAGISSMTHESAQFSPSSLFSSAFNSIENGCGAITNTIHITVSYAYVGPVDAPQAKITGIFYESEEPIYIPGSTEENRIKDVPVTTTVSFLDVTDKPTTRVATFPVVSVQLPADFFYPFSSSTPGSGAKKSARNDYYSLSSSLAFLLLVFGAFVL